MKKISYFISIGIIELHFVDIFKLNIDIIV